MGLFTFLLFSCPITFFVSSYRPVLDLKLKILYDQGVLSVVDSEYAMKIGQELSAFSDLTRPGLGIRIRGSDPAQVLRKARIRSNLEKV